MRHWVGKRENQHFQWVTCFYNWKKLPSETQSSSVAAAEWMQNVSSSPSRVEPTKSLNRAFHACAALLIDWKYFIVNWWRFAVYFLLCTPVHMLLLFTTVERVGQQVCGRKRNETKNVVIITAHTRVENFIIPVSRHLCRFSSLSPLLLSVFTSILAHS